MTTLQLIINGRTVDAHSGQSILDAALNAGIFIPNLCYHPDLEPLGACNLCVVEIAGRDGIHPACSTPAENGMEITTETEQLNKVRRMSMQLMLTDHTA